MRRGAAGTGTERPRLIQTLASLAPRYLPFADVATPDLPLSRLLRLSLFQVSVGMALVLLVGTLNRVMIVELDVPAALVGIMLALPIVFAPFRALIGHKSDTHRSALGWRRVPFIWKGSLWQFGGFAIMPFALLVLAGRGEAATLPAWIGQCAAALAFLLVGAGVHLVQTAGLALATDLTPERSHPRVVGLMYVMLLVGMSVSAITFGAALRDFSPGRLVQVIQGAAVLTLVLNAVSMWKQEPRRPRGAPLPEREPSFAETWTAFSGSRHTLLHLLVIGIGTLGFGMADILLEPFGGEVLGMSVSATTTLTALFAVGGLLGFAFASSVIGRGADPYRIAQSGAFVGIPAFGAVIVAAPLGDPLVFVFGNFLIGFGAALFSHGTLTATMRRAPEDQAGLALGAWGSVQATAAGAAIGLSGILRDVITGLMERTGLDWAGGATASGYVAVYVLEITLLLAVVIAMLPLLRAQRGAKGAVALAASDTAEHLGGDGDARDASPA